MLPDFLQRRTGKSAKRFIILYHEHPDWRHASAAASARTSSHVRNTPLVKVPAVSSLTWLCNRFGTLKNSQMCADE